MTVPLVFPMLEVMIFYACVGYVGIYAEGKQILAGMEMFA